MSNANENIVRVVLAAVGGQGSLMATTVIGEACHAHGLEVVTSEVHGMAQRGGIVESAVVVGGERSPVVAGGGAHVLLAFEPVEAARALAKCNPRTIAVVSTAPMVPTTVAMGRDRYPQWSELEPRVRAAVGRLVAFDGRALAVQAGSDRVLSAIMVGALAGTGLLALPRHRWTDALLARVPPKHADANLRAFELGHDTVHGALAVAA